jgi:thymidylate synthase
MALAPCHALFQFYVQNNKLSCLLFQRSVDLFLGGPYNFALYALLTHMIAQQCDLDVDEVIWTGGCCHLYANTISQTQLQITRQPYPLPQLTIARKPSSIFDYRYEDFQIDNYQYHPHIAAPVAV